MDSPTTNHDDAILDSEIALNAVSYLQAFINEKKEDKKKIENLTKENEKLINKIKDCFNSLFVEKQKIEQFEEKIGDLTEENKKLKNKIKSLNTDKTQVYYNKIKEDFDSLFVEKQQIKQLEEKIEDRENTIRELGKINSNLKKQASKYQSTLDDENNSVQLKDDISRLQKALDAYVTNLRPNIDLNLKNIKTILKKYKSKTRLTSKPSDDIPLIKAVLQRHVLETIFCYFSIYTNYKDIGKSYLLEAQIERKADELVLLTEEFAKTREGNDDITPAVPVKIRQQIYSALGNRGFSYIINDQQTCEHKFIDRFKTELNEEMERYRKILNATKKVEIEEKATNIILDVVKILQFRINTQEPIIQTRFFQYNDKINPSLMNGTWGDDNFHDFEVDICKFPLMGIELDDDLKRKIYTKAIIYPREVNSQVNNSETDSEDSEIKLEAHSFNSEIKKKKSWLRRVYSYYDDTTGIKK